MNTFELLKTHYHDRGPDGLARLTKVKPYILLKQGRDDPPIYLKGGSVYWEDGKPVPTEKLPSWFEDELKKCSRESLLEVGFDEDEVDIILAPEKTNRRQVKSAANEAPIDEAELYDGDGEP
jgi:hypothetical protein